MKRVNCGTVCVLFSTVFCLLCAKLFHSNCIYQCFLIDNFSHPVLKAIFKYRNHTSIDAIKNLKGTVM